MSMRAMILASAAVLALAPWASAQDGGSADSPGNQSQTDDGAGRDGATGNQANPANDSVDAPGSGRDGALGNQAHEDDADDTDQQQDRVADSPTTDDGEQPAAAAPEEMIEPAAGTTLTDREFVERVAISNFFEITSSELASERAEDPQVQSFAAHMIEDHSEAGDKFAAARAEADIGSTAISEEDRAAAVQKHIDGLEALDGAAFDQAYVDLQVRAHEQAVELFRTYAHTGSEDSLRAFADEMLPTLEAHLQQVRQLDSQS